MSDHTIFRTLLWGTYVLGFVGAWISIYSTLAEADSRMVELPTSGRVMARFFVTTLIAAVWPAFYVISRVGEQLRDDD